MLKVERFAADTFSMTTLDFTDASLSFNRWAMDEGNCGDMFNIKRADRIVAKVGLNGVNELRGQIGDQVEQQIAAAVEHTAQLQASHDFDYTLLYSAICAKAGESTGGGCRSCSEAHLKVAFEAMGLGAKYNWGRISQGKAPSARDMLHMLDWITGTPWSSLLAGNRRRLA